VVRAGWPTPPSLVPCCPPGLRLIQKAVMAPFGFMTFQLCLCYEYRTELERHHEHDAS